MSRDVASTGVVQRISDMTPEARRAGARAGMTMAQAETVCPGVRLPGRPGDCEAPGPRLPTSAHAFVIRIECEDERIFFAVEDLGTVYPSQQADHASL